MEHDAFIPLAHAPLARQPSRSTSATPHEAASTPIPLSQRRRVQLPPDALIGRHGDLQRIRQALLVDGRRLVTLLGRGGIGKTRLTLQAAADLAAHFDDGVAFVALAPLSDAAEVAITVGEALGCSLPATQPAEQALLIVLDNLEHL